jgi:hypothetical protein
MNRADLDRKLESLEQASQRISNNLVELEIDPSRQLLEASRLEGRSAELWTAASAALTELWRRRSLLEALLERADRLRSAKHAEELRALLEEKSIELSDTTVPLAERQLLETARITERCSADQLVAAMAASFDEVKRAIAELTAPWDALTPKLDAARGLLEEARALDAEHGQTLGVDLERDAQILRDLTKQLATDPLSVGANQVDELLQDVRARRGDLEQMAALKGGFEAKLAHARELLDRLQATVDAVQAAHEELVLKVAVASPPASSEFDSSLEVELERVVELGRDEAWGEAASELKGVTDRAELRLAEARAALDANRAPIQARNQFRGLLEAYQIKARRLGILEDPELQDVFLRAQDVLYNAPSDLALAAQLVRSYQIALSKSESTRRAGV